MKILTEMYFWTKTEVSTKFYKSPGSGLGQTSELDRNRLGGGLRSSNAVSRLEKVALDSDAK